MDTPTSSTNNFLNIGNAIYATGLGSTPLIGIGSNAPQVTLDMNIRTDAIALPSGLIGTRPSGINGEIRYSQTDNALEAFINGAWTDLVAASGSTSGVNLGTTAGATNPHRTSDTTTGLFSAATGTVSIATAGTDQADFAAAGLNLPQTTESYKLAGNNAIWQDAANFDLAVGVTGLPTAMTVGTQHNVAVGPLALNVNTTGAENTAVGAFALDSNTTGSSNAAVGYGALAVNTVGYRNAAFGYAALSGNTTGTYNTGLGFFALHSNTTGTGNVAIGANVASTTLSTGSNNILIGTDATTDTYAAATSTAIGIGQGVKPGTNDVGIGYQALNATAGNSQSNTAIGYQALKANTTGANNAAIGYQVLTANISGSSDTALGGSALTANTGGNLNTAMGASALQSNTTGTSNTALGASALIANTTGLGNTAVGRSALGSTTTGSSNTAIGNNVGSTTLATGSNNILIGVDNTTDTYAAGTSLAIGIGQGVKPGTNDVGIGYQALNATAGNSQSNTAVGYQTLKANTTGYQNIAIGNQALAANTTGPNNTAVGVQALWRNTGGFSDIAVGTSALQNNTTGYQNTAVGLSALFANTTGVDNLGIGTYALAANTTGTNNTVLGFSVAQTTLNGGSNNILIGTSSAVDTPLATTSNFLNIGNAIYATGLGGTPLIGIGSISPQVTLDMNIRTDAIALPSGLLAQRPSGINGEIRYSQTDNALEAYVNGVWTDLITTGGTTSGINLGTSATASNPHRTGQNGTGLFSANSNQVSVADNGVDVMDVNTNSVNIIGTIVASNYSMGYQINGSNAVWQDTTNFNLAVGATALPTLVAPSGLPGTYNTAIGVNALNANTTGYLNTAVGALALSSNTTGGSNVAIGQGTLPQNTVGSNNTALGTQAMNASTTGNFNTAVGRTSMASNTTGNYNTAVGYISLASNTTGNNNTAIGASALSSSTTGVNNTAFGYQAGYDVTTGGHNIAIGDYATTAVGVTTGSNNILIGQDVRPASRTGNNQLNIGNLIYATGLASGSTASTGLVGIGSTSPQVSLDLDAETDALALPSGLSNQRPTTGVANGDIRYSQSLNAVEGYVNGAWETFVTSTGGTSTIYLGTSAAATSPQRNGEAGTGLYSANSGQVSVAVSVAGTGTDVADFNSTGINIIGTVTPGSDMPSLQINGNNAVWQDPAHTNLAVGSTAFPTTVLHTTGKTGTQNTAIGINALTASTTAQGNTAVGTSALIANTFGNLNTAVGSFTLFANTTGNENIAVGSGALENSTTASQNTAVGFLAGYALGTGNFNTFLGYASAAAFSASITGSYNTGIGSNALNQMQTTAADNTAVGFSTLTSIVTGVNNTALGFQAGYDVSTGGHNIILGDYATTAVGITTGSNNVMIGQDVRPPSQTGNNQLNIGNLIYATGLASGSTASTGLIGIGSASPLVSLDLSQKSDAVALPSGLLGVRPAGVNGELRYSQTDNALEAYVNGVWTDLLTSGGTTSVITLGTSATATNPRRTGEAGTGLFSATTGTVSIAGLGSDIVDFSATGSNILGTIVAGSYSIGYQINGQNAIWEDNTNFNIAVGSTGLPTSVSQSGGSGNGQKNTAMGYGALSYDTTGGDNTAIGYLALNFNDTGFNNTAVGYQALSTNTANNNTAVGYDALYFNSTGQGNTAMGMFAMLRNTTGQYNTAVGFQSLNASSTGQYNTALGSLTLSHATTGQNNTAIGASALQNTTTGQGNTAVGSNALGSNTTGVNNTALGVSAGASISTGTYNIAIGYSTGAGGVTSGSNNIMIGSDVRPASSTADNQLNIGNLIYATGLSFGSTMSTGFVGIGSASPQVSLDMNLETDALALPSGLVTQRPSGINGEIRYNQSANTLEAYINGAWTSLITSSGGTSSITLGTSAAATNPQRSGEAGTGLFSATSGIVSVAGLGTGLR